MFRVPPDIFFDEGAAERIGSGNMRRSQTAVDEQDPNGGFPLGGLWVRPPEYSTSNGSAISLKWKETTTASTVGSVKHRPFGPPGEAEADALAEGLRSIFVRTLKTTISPEEMDSLHDDGKRRGKDES